MIVASKDGGERILSVRQPWAWAIVAGHKDVENRSKRTSYRGRLFIHASLRPSAEGLAYCRRAELELPELQYGVVLGSVELYDVTDRSSSRWWIPGNFAWALRNPSVLTRPMPLKGRLGIFRASPAEARRLRQAAHQIG
jgi:hypothetical protein